MVKTIILNRDGSARFEEGEPFLLPNILELHLKAVGYDMSNVFVSLSNGTIKKHLKIQGNTFEVDKELLFAGFLNIRVQMYHNGELAKIWDVYPLKLVETNFGIECFEYLKIIENKLDQLKEDVLALQKAHEIIK